MTRLRAAAAAGLVVVLGGGAAWAYWSAPSTAGSAGASAAASVDAGPTPTANAAGTSVTVSWSATTLSSGAPVSGYQVKRYDAGTLAPQTILAGCAGTVTGTSCVETSVPEGRWVYSVTPLVGSSWTGDESANSVPVWVDTTAPTNSISLDPVSGNSFKNGNTVFYKGNAAGSFRLTNAVNDAGSGPASSQTAALGGTSTGWAHTPSTVSTPAGGPFQSNEFSWSNPTTSSPTLNVTGRDGSGNTAVTGLTFINDTAAPTGVSATATGLVGTGTRYAVSTSLSVTLNKGTDALSQVAPTGAQLLRAQGILTSSSGATGSCSSFSTYTLVSGGSDPATPKSDVVSDQLCFRYRYTVPDNVGNVATFTMNNTQEIRVDLTPPSTPTLSFSALTNAWWPGSGDVVFYRSAAPSGSFTVTASATDTKSGVASYGFPTLGTNWTSTPGSLGVNTYSWSGTPATPAGPAVTATNHATGVSPGSTFVPTVDNTAPTGASVSYADGDTTSTTVVVTLANGSDGSGSGVGTTSLQRASAPLTNNVCGSFSGFLTIASNPATTYNDTGLARDTCYRYQLVVPDRVGNSVTVTSASTAKVQSYNTAVRATPGLLSHWRLGETTTSYDSFTGTPGVTLQSRAGETGTTWTKSTATGAADLVLDGGRVRKNGTNAFGRYWTSGLPASADYTVEADVYVATRLTNDWLAVLGRLDTTVQNGTYYAAGYDEPTQSWALRRVVNGTVTTLGTPFGQTLTPGSSYHVSLEMTGSTIRLLVDGVQRVTATDATITAAGRGGVQQGNGIDAITVTSASGLHLDNLRVTPPLADSFGSNVGSYLNAVVLGVAGAITGDASTAAQFDGTSNHAKVTRQISDDFSIELWFKSTQGIGTSTSWTGGAGLVDADVAGTSNDFGISLRSDGRVVAGTGSPDTSIVSSAGGYNNGAWHHVVLTRTRSSGALTLYVNGTVAGTATGGTASLTSPTTLDFGRIASGTNYFAGTLDEIAVYTTAISGATVSAHYAAR